MPSGKLAGPYDQSKARRLAGLGTRYDDGGYSGATMDRPALQRLIEDVQAGNVKL